MNAGEQSGDSWGICFLKHCAEGRVGSSSCARSRDRKSKDALQLAHPLQITSYAFFPFFPPDFKISYWISFLFSHCLSVTNWSVSGWWRKEESHGLWDAVRVGLQNANLNYWVIHSTPGARTETPGKNWRKQTQCTDLKMMPTSISQFEMMP